MKILRPYINEIRTSGAFHTNSPLLKELKRLYDVTELVIPGDISSEDYANILREYDVVLTMWGSKLIPPELGTNPGNLKYVCNITGSLKRYVPQEIIDSPYIQVTNWGDAPAFEIAEGAFSLMMTMLKDIPYFIDCARKGLDRPGTDTRRVGTLFNTRVGIYGVGAIGRKFIDMLRPFKPEIFAFDPYVSQENMPEGVKKVDTMEELFSLAQILVVHAGLCDETRGSIKKEHLALLPDGALFINTARGGIVEEPALIAEIISGRIRAGLDVMDTSLNPKNGDMPAIDDPVRQVSNAVFSGHHIGGGEWGSDPEVLSFASLNCLENIRRFSCGEPLKFVMDAARYKLST